MLIKFPCWVLDTHTLLLNAVAVYREGVEQQIYIRITASVFVSAYTEVRVGERDNERKMEREKNGHSTNKNEK